MIMFKLCFVTDDRFGSNIDSIINLSLVVLHVVAREPTDPA